MDSMRGVVGRGTAPNSGVQRSARASVHRDSSVTPRPADRIVRPTDGESMIPREELPDDAAEWSSVRVTFNRLPLDTPESCPCAVDDVFEYVQLESADADHADRDRLAFVRTAQVADARFWLWTYTESNGEQVFVAYQLNSDDSSVLGLASPNGLDAEQYMLAEYYDEVHWS
jgi:hypothetical protein